MRVMRVKCYGEKCNPNNIKHLNVEMTKVGNKNYCDECLKLKKKTDRNRTILYHYIEDMSGISFPTKRMLAQIKEMKKNNYTYFGIYHSLEYMVEVKNKSLANDYFLGYVPYIYEDARSWYIEKYTEQKLRERNGYSEVQKPTKIEFNYEMNSNNSKDLISADGLLD